MEPTPITLSLIITTTALDAPSQCYADRAFALRNFLLPRYVYDPNISEVIVAGAWEPVPNNEYTYVPVASMHRNIGDAVRQRQAGFEAAHGDVLAFQSDDHLFSGDLMNAPRLLDEFNADVLVPTRLTRLRSFAGERLNGGEPGVDIAVPQGYVPWHGAVYRRSAIVDCPWEAIEPPYNGAVDVIHTVHLLRAGKRIVFTNGVTLYDVENGGQPWPKS